MFTINSNKTILMLQCKIKVTQTMPRMCRNDAAIIAAHTMKSYWPISPNSYRKYEATHQQNVIVLHTQ